MNLMEKIKRHIIEVLEQAFVAADLGKPSVEQLESSLSYPDISFGDLASSVALQQAAELKRPPLELAEALAKQISPDQTIAAVEVKVPGFINFKLTDEAYGQTAATALQNWEGYFAPDKAKNKSQTMVIDYSHPNAGKPMGVHHLLSTIIGDAIKLTYKTAGWQAVADNFIGDLGTQFGKLIWAVKQWGDLSAIEKDPVNELQKLYVKFHIEADSDDKLDDAGREEYRKLEQGDKENRALWQKIVGWSLAEIQPIYDRLDIKFDYMHGESFYEDKIEAIIKAGKKASIFVEDQGALIYRMADPDLPPAIVQKRDGASLYLTRDLARIAYWQKTWQPQLMVNVVDVAQSLQFRQLFEISERLGLTTAQQKHVEFGRMRFSDSSMSTRRGNILFLSDLLDEARKRTADVVASKSSELSPPEKDQLAETLSVAAIKYNILRQNRHTNITFDWDSILSLEGSSAPYVAYALSRAASVRAKSKNEALADAKNLTFDAKEKELLREILSLPETLQKSAVEFRPNILLQQLYDVTQKYSNFYNDKRILDAPTEAEKSARLILNNLFLEAVSNGFEALGIKLPNRM